MTANSQGVPLNGPTTNQITDNPLLQQLMMPQNNGMNDVNDADSL